MTFTLTGGFWVGATWLLVMFIYLWITNPKHRRTRRLLGPIVWLWLGLAIRVGVVR